MEGDLGSLSLASAAAAAAAEAVSGAISESALRWRLGLGAGKSTAGRFLTRRPPRRVRLRAGGGGGAAAVNADLT